MQFDVEGFLDQVNKNPSAIGRIAKAFSDALTASRQQQIIDEKMNDREVVQIVRLSTADLGTERTVQNAMPIPFAFKSVRVQSASGADVKVQMVIGNNVSGKAPIQLKLNDTISFGFVRKGWLYWESQLGETMEILFGLDVDFKQGSLITQQTGSVIVGEGTNIEEDDADVSVGDTPTLLSAESTTATSRIFRNKGSNRIYLGNSLVAFGVGARYLDTGDYWEYKGSAAVYGVCDTSLSSDCGVSQLSA